MVAIAGTLGPLGLMYACKNLCYMLIQVRVCVKIMRLIVGDVCPCSPFFSRHLQHKARPQYRMQWSDYAVNAIAAAVAAAQCL